MVVSKYPVRDEIMDPLAMFLASADGRGIRVPRGVDHMLNNKSIGATACLAPHIPERRWVSNYYADGRQFRTLRSVLKGTRAHMREEKRATERTMNSSVSLPNLNRSLSDIEALKTASRKPASGEERAQTAAVTRRS
jgi:hypothetical protein